MDVPTHSTLPLSWTRTSDGVVVLRYYDEGMSDAGLRGLTSVVVFGGSRHEAVPLLVDLRAMPAEASAQAVGKFVSGFPDLARRLPQRRAYLVRDQGQIGLARMIQSQAEPLRIETGYFTRWDEALDWLRTPH